MSAAQREVGRVSGERGMVRTLWSASASIHTNAYHTHMVLNLNIPICTQVRERYIVRVRHGGRRRWLAGAGRSERPSGLSNARQSWFIKFGVVHILPSRCCRSVETQMPGRYVLFWLLGRWLTTDRRHREIAACEQSQKNNIRRTEHCDLPFASPQVTGMPYSTERSRLETTRQVMRVK